LSGLRAIALLVKRVEAVLRRVKVRPSTHFFAAEGVDARNNNKAGPDADRLMQTHPR